MQVKLNEFKDRLLEMGFEAVIGDGVVEAAKEEGNLAVEIKIDTGGGCLVVKRGRLKGEKGVFSEKRSWNFKGKEISIVREKLSTETFRVQLESPQDLQLIEKEIAGE